MFKCSVVYRPLSCDGVRHFSYHAAHHFVFDNLGFHAVVDSAGAAGTNKAVVKYRYSQLTFKTDTGTTEIDIAALGAVVEQLSGTMEELDVVAGEVTVDCRAVVDLTGWAILRVLRCPLRVLVGARQLWEAVSVGVRAVMVCSGGAWDGEVARNEFEGLLERGGLRRGLFYAYWSDVSMRV